ncbi:DNA internalization-related competence protein ComEC/Rec2 [Desulfovirgula thermocuniculi]|uniref:DNA internalization-related competence protein ComEC/Rec2 n=1 Tax=Desulfovirgula thermocuniculi TaxID=348842 RepID=UPI00146FBBD6|nr:DNA internalization-related competence protein ComEC/Rec2 [Desulfovirgula thermocuniculi]
MGARPLVSLTIAFAAGVAAFEVCGPAAGEALALCGALFLLALIGYLRRWAGTFYLSLCLFAALGLFSAALASARCLDSSLLEFEGHWVTAEGTVVREADVRPDRIYYWLALERLACGAEARAVRATVLVRAPLRGPVYAYGDRLGVHGLLIRPGEPGNPGEFNFRRYLARRGTGALLLVRGPADIRKLGAGGSALRRALWGLKERLLAVNRQALPPEKAALLNGIVFGVQGPVEQKTRDLFGEAGVVHILSVSGLHVGLVLGGLLFLLKLVHLPSRWTAPVASPLLVLYALLCGLGPAVSRSTLMALFLLWARRLGRPYSWPAALAGSALLILALDPFSLYDIGFQLSFAATWGILSWGPVLDGWLQKWPIRPAWMRGILWVTLAAQLATLPLTARYYNYVSPVSLLSNIAAVPLSGLLLALGMAAAASGLLCPAFASLVHASTSLALDALVALISFCRDLPGAVVYVPTPPWALVAAWYLCGSLVFREGGGGAASPSRRRTLLAASGALVVLLYLLVFGIPGGSRLEAHFIDVGQGDSIFLKTPGGRCALVDAGDGVAGEKVVVPYLRRLGVRRLDVVVVTHPHEDHAGGLPAVMRAFPVGLVLVSPFCSGESAEPLPPFYRAFLDGLGTRGIKVQEAGSGDILHLDPNLEVKVIGPPQPPLTGTRSDLNNASLVLQVRYGRQLLLLTGDAEAEAQRFLLGNVEGPGCTLLKVPHHGSRYLLSSFVEALRPQLAVISVGSRNSFGQPAPEALELLQRAGARIYRTDYDGAVIFGSDGYRFAVRTGKGR